MKKLSLIYIVIASILWGTSGIFVHFMAPLGFSSLQMTFLRAFSSCLILCFYILFFDRSLFKINRHNLFLYICSGLSFFVTASCYFFSMQKTSVSTSVVLMYSAPVFVMIYSVIFFREMLTKEKLISLIGMLIGCGLVSGIIGGLKFNIVGIIAGFLSGLSYAAYNIITKIEMRRGCNPVQATFYTFVFASIFGLFCSNISSIPSAFATHPVLAAVLSGSIGIVTCASPYFLYTIALKHIPAGTASTLGILEPMAATLFSIVLFSEPIDLYSGFGILLILFSVFLLGKTTE